MTFLQRLYLWLTSEPQTHVSAAWLRQQARAETTVGWDGPRWRFPKERA